MKGSVKFKPARLQEAVKVKPENYIVIKPKQKEQEAKEEEKQDSSESESESQGESDSEESSEEDEKSEEEEKHSSESQIESESESDTEAIKFDKDNSSESEEESEQATPLPKTESTVKKVYKVLDINEDPSDKGSRLHSTIHKSWAQGSRSPRGLLNTGVTCYMNSAIQMFFHVPPFVRFLQDVQKNRVSEVSKSSVTKDLANLWQKLVDPNISRNVYPDAIIKRLDEINPMMSVWQQEDSHEYFMSLLSRVQEDTVPPGKKLRTSIVHEIFGGTYEQKVTCQTCNTVSTTHQDFYDLPVSFSPREKKQRNAYSLQGSIRDFFSPATIKCEKNKPGSGYDCESCKKLTTAITVSKIEEPSEYLPINIKRFNFHDRSSRKIKDPIQYPMELDLSEYSINPEVPLKYQLIGVTLHEGRTTSSGHYVALCNQPNKTWSLYDDESVRKASDKVVLRHQEAAYFLIYARLTPVEVSSSSATTPISKSIPSFKTASHSAPSTPSSLGKKRKSEIFSDPHPKKSKSDSISTSTSSSLKPTNSTPSPLHSHSKPKFHRAKSLPIVSSKKHHQKLKPTSPHSTFARMTEKLNKKKQEKKARKHAEKENKKKEKKAHNGEQIKKKLDSEIDQIFGP